MKTQRLAIVITVINLSIMLITLAHLHPATAQSVAPVLRGRALEIVDDQGKVRASIKLHPADPSAKMPDGKTGYPETVMLRLIDRNGRPEVKMGASEQGGGLGLIGADDTTHALLQAEGTGTSLKLTNKEGRQTLIKP